MQWLVAWYTVYLAQVACKLKHLTDHDKADVHYHQDLTRNHTHYAAKRESRRDKVNTIQGIVQLNHNLSVSQIL